MKLTRCHKISCLFWRLPLCKFQHFLKNHERHIVHFFFLRPSSLFQHYVCSTSELCKLFKLWRQPACHHQLDRVLIYYSWYQLPINPLSVRLLLKTIILKRIMHKIFLRGIPLVRCWQWWIHHEAWNVQYRRRNL